MTLHYDFPCISYIQNVLKHIEGNENFIVVKKDGYTAVNYIRSGKETHPEVTDHQSAIYRELRGLIFENEWGQLISRPFHKFFNVGEREDIVADLSRPHVIMTKLDGSMIRPLKLGDNIRWATKMGVTEVAMQAEVFVAKNPNYIDFAYTCMEQNVTPLFEWCSRQQQIVVDYPEDSLVLLAIRDNFTGAYFDRDELELISQKWNIPLVEVHNMANRSLEDIIAFTRELKGLEGFVIQFEDGHMVKIKADDYVRLHRAKSLLDNERDVVGLIIDEKTDDLLGLLPEVDKKNLTRFEDSVWHDILKFQTLVNLTLSLTSKMTRKEFALCSDITCPLVRSACFAHWDEGVCSLDYIKTFIKKNLGSKSNFTKLNPIFKTAKWKETAIND